MNHYALMRTLLILLRMRPEISHIVKGGSLSESTILQHLRSQFYLISHRQRSHDKFAQEIMCPKTFHSRYTAHGIKYEPVAIDMYHKDMHSQKTPVHVFKSGFVVCTHSPILGCSPDRKVIDPNCEDPFGLL